MSDYFKFYGKDYFLNFDEDIEIAYRSGKEVFINERNRLNNSRYNREHLGRPSLQKLFKVFFDEFVNKVGKEKIRPSVFENVYKFMNCKDYDNGYLWFENNCMVNKSQMD